jgi:hypothetical protein
MNKYLKSILQKTVTKSKSKWHVMLYPTLWEYRTTLNTSINFSLFLLVHWVDSILPIQCEIPSLKLEIELLPDTIDLEECLVNLEQLDEQHRYATSSIKENKRCVKVQYDKYVHTQLYTEGDLEILYDQAKEPSREGKFNSKWHGPYIVRRFLEKGAYKLEYYEENVLEEPRNVLYIKQYYT